MRLLTNSVRITCDNFDRCETTDGTQSPKSKQRLSFSFPIEQVPPQSKHNSDEEDEGGNPVDQSAMLKELTCISEEGLADIDFQVNNSNTYQLN